MDNRIYITLKSGSGKTQFTVVRDSEEHQNLLACGYSEITEPEVTGNTPKVKPSKGE